MKFSLTEGGRIVVSLQFQATAITSENDNDGIALLQLPFTSLPHPSLLFSPHGFLGLSLFYLIYSSLVLSLSYPHQLHSPILAPACISPPTRRRGIYMRLYYTRPTYILPASFLSLDNVSMSSPDIFHHLSTVSVFPRLSTRMRRRGRFQVPTVISS